MSNRLTRKLTIEIDKEVTSLDGKTTVRLQDQQVRKQAIHMLLHRPMVT
jgi:hypothetical protein